MVELVRQNFKTNKKIYNETKHNLRKKLDKSIPIEHVGSTAIPNMYGKNIIDILIGAKNIDEFKYISNILKDMRYISSDKSKTDIYTFFASTSDETKSGDIHIHLVLINTKRYKDFLILRNYLLEQKEEAKNYSNFKKELIKSKITDRNEYKNIKSKYVSDLIDRANKYYKG